MFYHALISKGGDLKPVLLWENSSPTSAFAAQTVSLDLSDYAGVIVELNNDTESNSTICSRVYVKKSDNVYMGSGRVINNITRGNSRSVQITDNGVNFGSCYSGTDTSTTELIPIKIYGVKKYVVEIDYDKHYVQWSAANSPYVLETDKPVQMIYFKNSSTASEYLAAYLNDGGTYSSYSTGFVFTKISDTKIKIGYSSSSENFTSGTFQVYYII